MEYKRPVEATRLDTVHVRKCITHSLNEKKKKKPSYIGLMMGWIIICDKEKWSMKIGYLP